MVSIRPPSNFSRRLSESAEDRQVRSNLPTMYDLPSEDPEEPGLPDEYHDLQPQLLSRTLNLAQYARSEWFAASDLNLYYDVEHQQWYKRPDWFLAVGVSRLYDGEEMRRSYVVWQEGKAPDVIVEFLSAGTAAEDLGRFLDQSSPMDSGEGDRPEIPARVLPSLEVDAVEKEISGKPPAKLKVYESYLQVPHYIVYSRYTKRLRYFRWVNGEYQERSLNASNPLIWLDDLGIGLGIWSGQFDGVGGDWLRWCDGDGTWLLTDTEEERRAKEEERRGKEEERRAKEEERWGKEQAEAQLLQTARNLLASGMELAQVIQIMGLSAAQVVALRTAP